MELSHPPPLTNSHPPKLSISFPPPTLQLRSFARLKIPHRRFRLVPAQPIHGLHILPERGIQERLWDPGKVILEGGCAGSWISCGGGGSGLDGIICGVGIGLQDFGFGFCKGLFGGNEEAVFFASCLECHFTWTRGCLGVVGGGLDWVPVSGMGWMLNVCGV
ncbi:hypothetical protein BJX96DRAFT_94525 [Aspergillus floccosus]